MAKGWESKSVEALAGVFEVRPNAPARNVPDPATLNLLPRKKESFSLGHESWPNCSLRKIRVTVNS